MSANGQRLPSTTGPAVDSFYVTGGTLRHDAACYVERKADNDLLEGLRRGEFCYVLTSRQMGKSSLMVRTATRLREQGIAVVVLDLTAIGQNLTIEQWYDGVITRVGAELGLENELDEFCQQAHRLSPLQRTFAALREVVLRKRSTPVVIFVDEIDTVRSLRFSTDEFFAAIRECYNRRAEDAELRRLTFCLLGVGTPSDLIRDVRLTPFNIGRRIELNDFSSQEALPLAVGLELQSTKAGETPALPGASGTDQASRLLERVLYWTHGHPYLTQRLCQAVTQSASPHHKQTVDHCCADLFFTTRARERDDNLLFVRERILHSEADRANLLHFYEQVLRGTKFLSTGAPDDETNPLVAVLRLTGVVRRQGNRLRVRNRIYARVFDREWVRANMPDAEVRRQRAAYRRGVIRATAIAAVVVAGMIVMVLVATEQAAKARRALAQSYLSQARAERMSGLAGQRWRGLKALREARPYHTNEALLRDEVIACLALADLEESQGRGVSQDAGKSLSASSETNGNIVLRNPEGGKVTTLAGFGRPVRQIRLAPDESVLLAEYEPGSENQIIVWDCKKGEKLFGVAHGIFANAVDFSVAPFDGGSGKLALGEQNGHVEVYALPGGKPIAELNLRWDSGSPRAPQVLRFNPSGDLLAEACLDDPNVQVWDIKTGRKPLRFFHPAKVFDISWHPRGEMFGTACGDGCIYLWDTNHTDKALKKLAGHENGVNAIAFNHSGTLLASAGLDETLRLWIPATERQIAHRLQGEILDRLQFSSTDGVLTAHVEGSQRSRTWSVSGYEYLALMVRAGLADELNSLDFSADGRWLAAATDEWTTIWDCSSGGELAVLNVSHAHGACFTAGGEILASTEAGLFQYSLEESTNPNQPPLRAGNGQRLLKVEELGAMAVSLNRTNAVVVHQDRVRIVSLVGTNSTSRRFAVGHHYRRLALHPEGTWMAAMTMHSNGIHIWNLSKTNATTEITNSAIQGGGTSAAPVVVTASVQPAATLSGGEYFVFSPDGKWLVTCWSNEFEFFQVGAWQRPAFSIPRLPASIQHAPVAFTRDGSVVALASSRYIVQLLRFTDNGRNPPKLIASLESPDHSPLELLTFSPDGTRLAAATMNLTVQLWNLALLRGSLAELNLDRDWPIYSCFGSSCPH